MIAATDFFTVEVLTFTGLVRYLVLFVIDIETRVQIAGIVRQPDGSWMNQVARNLTDNVDGFLNGKRYLIHDRDPLFTNEFREHRGVPARPRPWTRWTFWQHSETGQVPGIQGLVDLDVLAE